MISGRTRLYGIFGYPVTHTFSPAMHNAGFKKIGFDACYLPFEIHPARLADAVESIHSLGIKGVNVTIPHKQAIISVLDGLSDDARLIGAVNTIEVVGEKLIGHNTDGRGFIRSLKEMAKFNPKGKRFLIIGSGGAGRAIGFSLTLAGSREIQFYDLDSTRAGSLVEDIRTKTGSPVGAIMPRDLVAAAREADCLINATPLGLKKSDPLPLPVEGIYPGILVCDLVYNPPETRFMKTAKKRGAKLLNGLGMLLYQGVISFEIWTGVKAPVQVMKNALSRQIAGR